VAISLYPVDWPLAIFKVLTSEHQIISVILKAEKHVCEVLLSPTRG
jgi:hypothetical protein